MCEPVRSGGKLWVEVGHGRPEFGQGCEQLGERVIEGAAGAREAKVGIEQFEFVWLNPSGLEPWDELGGRQSEQRVQWTRLAEVQDLGGSTDLSHNRKCGCLNDGAQRRMGAEVGRVVSEASARLSVSSFDTLAPPISGLKDEGAWVSRVKATRKATAIEECCSGTQGFREKLGFGKRPIKDGRCGPLELMGFHEAEARSGKGLLEEESHVFWCGAWGPATFQRTA
jgi:hypothetical protein